VRREVAAISKEGERAREIERVVRCREERNNSKNAGRLSHFSVVSAVAKRLAFGHLVDFEM
jgi:hypothetical protein